MKRLIDPWNVFEDNYGQPLSGGFVHFYLTETATRRNTYSDQALTVLNPNPMPLGSDGRLQSDVYATGTFTVRSVDPYGATIESWPSVSSDINAEDVIYTPPFAGSESSNVEAALARVVYVSDFDAALDGTTADDVPFALAVTAAANATLVIDGPMKLNASVTVPATVYIIAQGTITMATGTYFTALLITHQKEKWQSGFNNYFDLRAFGSYAGLGSSVSQTAPFDAAVAALSNGDHLHISGGVRWFSTAPAAIQKSLDIWGLGMSSSSLVRNYVEAGGANVGFLTFRGSQCNGMHVRDFAVSAAAGSTGGSMIVFIANTNEGVGYSAVTRVFVSYTDATSQYIHGIFVNGEANQSAGPGWRAMFFDQAYAFVSSGGTSAFKLSCNTGAVGSIVASGPVLITGIGTASGEYSTVNLNVECTALMTLDYAGLCTIRGKADGVVMSANSQYCSFDGLITGSGTSSQAGTGNRIMSWNTHQSGSNTIASGSTAVTVAHSCALTPTAGQIHVTPTINPTNAVGTIWVDGITSGDFVVNCENDPGAGGLTFGWQVDCSR